MSSAHSRKKDKDRRTSLLRSYADLAGAATSRQRSEMLLQAARVEAELSNRAKSEFVAHMSHDLRTPLNAIIGFSDMLANTRIVGEDPAKAREYAGDIHHAGQHLLRIINTILDLARLESGECNLEIENCDLADVIHTTQLIATPQAREKRQRLLVVDVAGLPVVRCDLLKMKQILINLVSNAIKFTPPGGDIRVDVGSLADGGVVLRVTDTGPGMTTEEIGIALTRFGRVRNAMTQQEEGSGLGLTIVRQLCVLQGLAFQLRSHPGAGTCASVTFPPNLVIGQYVPVKEYLS